MLLTPMLTVGLMHAVRGRRQRPMPTPLDAVRRVPRRQGGAVAAAAAARPASTRLSTLPRWRSRHWPTTARCCSLATGQIGSRRPVGSRASLLLALDRLPAGLHAGADGTVVRAAVRRLARHPVAQGAVLQLRRRVAQRGRSCVYALAWFASRWSRFAGRSAAAARPRRSSGADVDAAVAAVAGRDDARSTARSGRPTATRSRPTSRADLRSHPSIGRSHARGARPGRQRAQRRRTPLGGDGRAATAPGGVRARWRWRGSAAKTGRAQRESAAV